MGCRGFVAATAVALGLVLAGAAAAGPRQVIFQLVPDLLTAPEWEQVKEALAEPFAAELAELRAQRVDMLDDRQTTVAKFDIDFDGVSELFVMLYGPDVVCFPEEGCLTAMLRRFQDSDPWRFDSAPVSIFSVGPPLLYVREEAAGPGRRTLFSSPDPLVAEPGPDVRVKFQHGAGTLPDPEWQTIAAELRETFGEDRVRSRDDVDTALFDANVLTNPLELIVTVRRGCPDAEACPTVAFKMQEGGVWSGAYLPEVENAYIGADGLPILFLRDEHRFGWRSGYTTRSGDARIRIPFIDWGGFGMTRAMLADISAVDRETGAWTGRDGGARSGAEFLRDPVLQKMALDRWVDELADPMIEGAGLDLLEGRVIDWNGTQIKVTHAGIQGAILAEGVAPVSVFFGMLGRRNYKVADEIADFPPGLFASFRAIVERMRALQNEEPVR